MHRSGIRRLLDVLVSDIAMKHADGLISAVVAYGCSDYVALENVRQQLPLILDALNKLPPKQQDEHIAPRPVLEFFFKLLTESGDREIQFFALSILLSTPTVLKLGDWMSNVWFPTEPVRMEFLKLLQLPQGNKVSWFPTEPVRYLQLPQGKKAYHDFLDLLNAGDGALVYSWECRSVVRECGSSVTDDSKSLLSINLGTRTISVPVLGRDIRLLFSNIENHEVIVENVKEIELLHLRIETTDKSSYSFLGFSDKTAASMFIKRGHLSQLLENESSTSHGNGEEEFLDFKPVREMSSLQEVILKHGDPEHIECEPKRGISQRVVKLEHGDPEHIEHKPNKRSINRGVSTQSKPKRVYRKKKSRGLHFIEGGNSGNKITKGLRRTTLKKSKMSAEKAVARVGRRNSRLGSSDSTN